MKLQIKIFFLIYFITISVYSSAQKRNTFFSFGVDYRIYPIEIENIPRGPQPEDNGLPSDDRKFWQAISIFGSYGIGIKQNWCISASIYGRYNLLHRTENINYISPSPTVLKPSKQNFKTRKNIKFDFFIDVEKKIKKKKNIEKNFFIIVGLGFTNINSKYDIVLTDSVESVAFDSRHYKGSMLHFGPRINIGYQFKKIKASLVGYLIEDPKHKHLTTLWPGISLCYELKNKKSKQK
ncbi:MAG: hypothetical protein R2796_06750 [Chitinophagaceae bacterium]